MSGKLMISAMSIVAGTLWLATSFAQIPADAPTGTTGQCKDGSYTASASKSGACSGHQGVRTWYASTGTAQAPAAAGAQPTMSAPPTAPAATAAQPTMSAPPTAPASGSGSTPPSTAMPGGGPGTVWVNKNTHVYHCPNDKSYGKTKNGSYMSEADAKTEGDRPAYNKPCT